MRYDESDYDETDDETEDEDKDVLIPTHYRCLVEQWRRLNISSRFNDYDLSPSGELTGRIEKRVRNHNGDLWRAYEEFMKYIIAPITSEIMECRIEEDDMDCRCEIYTDAQLRNIRFELKEMVAEVEHVYEEDMIVETRVRYKRPFKKSQQLDVTRMFR